MSLMPEKRTFKIFLVDDDPFYLQLFQHILHNLGYHQITTFDSGYDCLNRLHEQPDVIFLDHNMDNLTGYEVLKKIKRFDPNLYVVMISAQEEIKTAVDALKHGAFDYIQKGKDEEVKIKEVLLKISEVKELLQRSRPSMIRKFFQFF